MNKSKVNNDARFEILISTMNKTSLSFLDAMFPHHQLESLELLIINQTVKGKDLISNKNNIRVINSYEKGLSKSRNLAIKNAKGDICLLADDDVEYLPNFNSIILDTFSKLDTSTVIRFKIATICGDNYKSYPKVSKRLITKKDIESTSSVEIAFKRKDIIVKQITFNTLFGLGSHFTSGEEYLFLKKILNQDLIINFENKVIVRHKLIRSTSNIGSDAFIKAMAAQYYHDYNFFGYIVLLKFIFFLFRKKIVESENLFSKYKVGTNAIKTYKKLIKQSA